MSKILVTGGTGRLGTELQKYLKADFVGIEDYDITYLNSVRDNWDKYDLIIHMAAYTDVVKAEAEFEKCYDTNVTGTWNMVKTYDTVPFIYISTEYAHKPLGVYAHTKQLGEEIVKFHPKHLILRTLFKPRPWPFEFAYSDQYTQGDYVDTIAQILASTALFWKRDKSETRYMGTGRKTILDLARMTKQDVKPNRIKDYSYSSLIPYDYQD